MDYAELTGKVQTVLGTIDADSLGLTLPHEHLLTDLSTYFSEPKEASQRKLAYEPIKLENLFWVRTHRAQNLEDLKMNDEQVAIRESLLYKNEGGNTIVELSNNGLFRDPRGLARISRATGLNVIMGAGYYVGASHPPELSTKTAGEITEEIVSDITLGVGDTGIRSGIIGEIGCTVPLLETEQKVLRAGAAAQHRTGAAISIHPSSRDDLVLEIINILDNAGADLSRTIISHANHMGFSRTTLRKLADAGCYIEIDNFGQPAVPFPPFVFGRHLDVSSDTQRIDAIIQLIDDGYLNHILISQDVCFKTNLVTYGGYGYAHILRNVVHWMRAKGISDKQIHTIMVENPKHVLPFAPVKELAKQKAGL